MDLNYNLIFSIFVDLMKTAIPIAIFLWLTNVIIQFFFSLAFPKRSGRSE